MSSISVSTNHEISLTDVTLHTSLPLLYMLRWNVNSGSFPHYHPRFPAMLATSTITTTKKNQHHLNSCTINSKSSEIKWENLSKWSFDSKMKILCNTKTLKKQNIRRKDPIEQNHILKIRFILLINGSFGIIILVIFFNWHNFFSVCFLLSNVESSIVRA